MTRAEYTLKNQKFRVDFSKIGSIVRIIDLDSQNTVEFTDDSVEIETDFCCWTNKGNSPQNVVITENEIEFIYSDGNCKYSVKYQLKADSSWIDRNIGILPLKECSIYSITVHSELRKKPKECIDYHTFWNCPTVDFLRYDSYGIYCGIANPFFEFKNHGPHIELSFKPNMSVRENETWTAESNFYGIYNLEGILVEQELPKTALRYNDTDFPRYRNPSGHISLDRGEIRSFKKYADNYLELRVKEFKTVFYTFFCPLPQQPQTDEEENIYYHMIDNFTELGGDMIIFNPLVRNRSPLPYNDSYWDLAPAGSRAERILNYAKDKGLKIGFYMGSACDNNHYADSPMVEFASTYEKPSWKKIGICGEVSRENCIANDEFAEWFYMVQKNTIERFGLTIWDWDPGPGNAYFCYSNHHGHIPGKGGYKGFRNAMNVVKRLRATFPDLYIQGFHGTKEYGLWGFRGFDQHEAYWEQVPYDDATMYPDLSADRLTASGMRFQSWWCQNFRFMPAVINHGLVHRMCQCCISPKELIYLFDGLGWKYGIMSALAAGASLTVPLLPYDMDSVPGEYVKFFRKWTEWGKNNFEYSKNAVAFGHQLACGTVDGYGKFINDHGYLFLCNASPIVAQAEFVLGEETGLNKQGDYAFKELYPRENVYIFNSSAGKETFSYNEYVKINVPQYQVKLIEVTRSQNSDEKLYGIPGKINCNGNCLRITESMMPEGTTEEGIYCSKTATEIKKVIINDVEIPFVTADDGLHFNVQYGENIPRFIYDWKNESDCTVQCPNNSAYEKVVFTSEFVASYAIQQLLHEAVPHNKEHIDQIVRELEESTEEKNYAWAKPYRLYLVVPFSDASAIGNLEIYLNDIKHAHTCVTVKHYGRETRLIDYLDVTDFIKWGQINRIKLKIEGLPEKHFIGAYLYYPESHNTQLICNSKKKYAYPIVNQALYPVTKLLPDTETKGRKVRVESAWIQGGIIEEMRDYTVCASVNLPPEELEGVYFSAQVCIDNDFINNSLHADEMMSYDRKQKIWRRTLHMGNRQMLIIDCEQIHVWAVTKDGNVSPDYKLDTQWKLY